MLVIMPPAEPSPVPPDAPDAPVVVVAAAIVRDGRVLACRRRGGVHDGEWEFPGGKVEPGEDEVAALVRECREELGLDVRVGHRIGGDTPIAVGTLKLWAATAAGDPAMRVHDAERWVAAEEIDALPWIEADRALVAAVRTLLDPGLDPEPASGRD